MMPGYMPGIAPQFAAAPQAAGPVPNANAGNGQNVPAQNGNGMNDQSEYRKRISNEVCQFFARTGTCRFGDKCYRMHTNAPTANMTSSSNNNGFPNRQNFNNNSSTDQIFDPMGMGMSNEACIIKLRLPSDFHERVFKFTDDKKFAYGACFVKNNLYEKFDEVVRFINNFPVEQADSLLNSYIEGLRKTGIEPEQKIMSKSQVADLESKIQNSKLEELINAQKRTIEQQSESNKILTDSIQELVMSMKGSPPAKKQNTGSNLFCTPNAWSIPKKPSFTPSTAETKKSRTPFFQDINFDDLIDSDMDEQSDPINDDWVFDSDLTPAENLSRFAEHVCLHEAYRFRFFPKWDEFFQILPDLVGPKVDTDYTLTFTNLDQFPELSVWKYNGEVCARKEARCLMKALEDITEREVILTKFLLVCLSIHVNRFRNGSDVVTCLVQQFIPPTKSVWDNMVITVFGICNKSPLSVQMVATTIERLWNDGQ